LSGREPLGFNWCYETIVRQKGITIGKLSADYFGARIMPSLQDGGVGWGRGSTGCTRGSFENAGDGGGRVGGCGRPRYSGSPTPPTTQRVPACPRGSRVSHPTDEDLSAGTRVWRPALLSSKGGEEKENESRGAYLFICVRLRLFCGEDSAKVKWGHF
jgi:hypothetical protein